MVDMILVESSNIESVGYDSQTEQLFIRFRQSGGLYVYFGVPSAIFKELMQAPSKGSYLNRVIRNSYAFKRQ